jgi:hypothetical protein
MKNLVTKGAVCQKSGKNLFLEGRSCYHVVDGRIRPSKWKPSVILSGERVPKIHFLIAVAKSAA